MAEEIKFRLPSAIKYAYVDVKGTAEELSRVNFELLASLYANGLSAFQTAEIEAAKLIVQGAPPAPAETHQMHPEVKAGLAGMLSEQKGEPTLKDVKDAGLLQPVVPDRVLEVTEAAAEVKEQLGATEIASAGAPWEAAPKAAGPKPWEQAKPAATINIDDFDF